MSLLFMHLVKRISIPISCLTGNLSMAFRTPPVSPPRPNYLTGMRRVYSLEFRPHQLNSPDTGLADPLLGSAGSSGVSERSFLPQSIIYNWSCGHFSKPLLSATDDSEEIIARREEREKFALDHISKCQHSCVSFSLICLVLFKRKKSYSFFFLFFSWELC